LTTVTLVRVVGVSVVAGTSEVELPVVDGALGAGEDGAAEDAGVDSVTVSVEDVGVVSVTVVEETGGVLREMTMVGVKLSVSLVVAPELLVVAVVEGETGTTGELGAAGELGAIGTDVVEVVHSVEVVVVPTTVVVVYYIREPRISIVLTDRYLKRSLEDHFRDIS